MGREHNERCSFCKATQHPIVFRTKDYLGMHIWLCIRCARSIAEAVKKYDERPEPQHSSVQEVFYAGMCFAFNSKEQILKEEPRHIIVKEAEYGGLLDDLLQTVQQIELKPGYWIRLRYLMQRNSDTGEGEYDLRLSIVHPTERLIALINSQEPSGPEPRLDGQFVQVEGLWEVKHTVVLISVVRNSIAKTYHEEALKSFVAEVNGAK